MSSITAAKKKEVESPFGLTAIEAATIVPLSSIIPGKMTAENLSSLSAEALRNITPKNSGLGRPSQRHAGWRRLDGQEEMMKPGPFVGDRAFCFQGRAGLRRSKA